jgi:NAD(P)-dependent dehydrogenase (short-subunit alcohol dehydrogenase family)
MAGQFAGNIIWITGGGSGLGRSMALAFAREGGIVAVSGRRPDRLEAVVAELTAAGGQGLAIPCDVTLPEQVEAAVASILEAHSRLDVVVANAGFAVGGRFESLSTADWERQMAVNVVGLTTTARCALPALRESKGRLVLIGSVAAYIGLPGSSAYGSSKAAVRYIGASLSAELVGSGVTCTTIHPGFVESEIAQVDNEGRFNPERADKRPSQLMWPTDRAADVMLGAIRRRRREFVFTGHGHIATFLGQRLPNLSHWIVRTASRRR